MRKLNCQTSKQTCKDGGHSSCVHANAQIYGEAQAREREDRQTSSKVFPEENCATLSCILEGNSGLVSRLRRCASGQALLVLNGDTPKNIDSDTMFSAPDSQ